MVLATSRTGSSDKATSVSPCQTWPRRLRRLKTEPLLMVTPIEIGHSPGGAAVLAAAGLMQGGGHDRRADRSGACGQATGPGRNRSHTAYPHERALGENVAKAQNAPKCARKARNLAIKLTDVRLRTPCIPTISGRIFQEISSGTEGRNMIQLDESFDGRLVRVQAGETIEIALTENASTGFRWIFSPKCRATWTPTLRKLARAAQAQTTTPGAPAVRRLYFKAVKPGNVQLQLEYQRPWQPAAQPTRTFGLHIEVQLPAKSNAPGRDA